MIKMELNERILYICIYNIVVQTYCVPFLVLNMQE